MAITTALAAMVGRLYPLYSGNFKIINSRVARKFIKAVDEFAWCRCPGGEILVPLSDAVGRCIYFTGDYDRKITWLCRKVLRLGDTALDIGANLGIVTLTMAKAVGKAGVVYAFEPNPRLQSLLSRSIERNALLNVHLHNVALGDRPDILSLHVPSDNFGQGSLVFHSDNSQASHHVVKVERLSDIIERERLTSIRMIKIDVEGFEQKVLAGAEETLKGIRPDLIVFESNAQNQPIFRNRPAVQILRRHGYEFFSIPKAAFSISLRTIDLGRDEDPGHDIVAIAREKRPEFSSLF
jgi:FkbM family methyltransferase